MNARKLLAILLVALALVCLVTGYIWRFGPLSDNVRVDKDLSDAEELLEVPAPEGSQFGDDVPESEGGEETPEVESTSTEGANESPAAENTANAGNEQPPQDTTTADLKPESTIDRASNKPLDDPMADAVKVEFRCDAEGFTVCVAFRQPFPQEEYSRAVVITLTNPKTGASRSFQWQLHNGQVENGEVVSGGVKTTFGGTMVYDFDKGCLCITFADIAAFLDSLDLKPSDKVLVQVQTYHMATPQSPWTGDEETTTITVPLACEP